MLFYGFVCLILFMVSFFIILLQHYKDSSSRPKKARCYLPLFTYLWINIMFAVLSSQFISFWALLYVHKEPLFKSILLYELYSSHIAEEESEAWNSVDQLFKMSSLELMERLQCSLKERALLLWTVVPFLGWWRTK